LVVLVVGSWGEERGRLRGGVVWLLIVEEGQGEGGNAYTHHLLNDGELAAARW